MKWGKKKLSSSSSSSSRLPSISHIFPISWLSKFKQMSINSEPKHAKAKSKGKQNKESMCSPKCMPVGEDRGRFYSGNGDAFWRLSFGEESIMDEKKGTGVMNSFWHGPDDESQFQNSTRLMAEEENHKFSNTVSDVKSIREFPKNLKISPRNDAYTKERLVEIRTPRLRNGKDWNLSKIRRGIIEEKLLEAKIASREAENISKAAQSDIPERSPEGTIEMIEREDCRLLAAADSRKHGYLSFAASRNNNPKEAKDETLEWKKLKEMRIKEVKSKNEKQRKSLYISREFQRKRTKQSSKVRVYSPRTASKVEMCKIKALENMKKAKMKMKTARGRAEEGHTSLDSFAVVKCSYDPQKDFRDSMTEMIMEKRISQPKELEELLSCYLTLNSDEYHDLIIKVFRQVWFDLKQTCSDHELHTEHCNYD